MKGNVESIQALRKKLKKMPVTLAHAIAQRASPAMTQEALKSFAAGESVYGIPRPSRVDGGFMTLVRTGATQRTIQFVANGRLVRCVLGPKYARYLIRYGILPNGPLPPTWAKRISNIVHSYKAPL